MMMMMMMSWYHQVSLRLIHCKETNSAVRPSVMIMIHAKCCLTVYRHNFNVILLYCCMLFAGSFCRICVGSAVVPSARQLPGNCQKNSRIENGSVEVLKICCKQSLDHKL